MRMWQFSICRGNPQVWHNAPHYRHRNPRITPVRTIFVIMDSLNRHYLRCYGNEFAITPNIDRLAQRGTVFDNHFAGSLPCMPARREMLTGRVNFLETPWSPVQPWDECLPHHAARAARRVQPHDHRPLPLLPLRRRGLQHHLQLVGVPARPGGRHLAPAGAGAAQAGRCARLGGPLPLGLLAQPDLGAHGTRRGLFDAALLRARPGLHRAQPRRAGLAPAPGGVRPARAVRLSGALPRAVRRPLGPLPLHLAAVWPSRSRARRRGDGAPHPRLLRRRPDHGRPLARQAARQAG